jgi:outer membrane lipoprotein SlyB
MDTTCARKFSYYVSANPRRMSSKTVLLSVAAISAGVLSGCTSSSSRTPVYDRSQVGHVITEQRGEIIGVQDVVIKARSSSAGSAGVGSRVGSAAVAAAVLGSPIGAAVAAGQAIGGIAGASMDNERGEELTILMKDGRSIVVVQPRGTVPFSIGDRVRVMTGSSSSIYGDPSTRVVPDENPVIGAR